MFDRPVLIEPGADEGLFTTLEYFVLNPGEAERMGKAAREKVLPFTWDAYGERWGEIISEVGRGISDSGFRMCEG